MCCFNILSILRYLEKTQVNPSVLELKKIIQHSARQNARVHLKGDRAHMSSSVAQQGSSANRVRAQSQSAQAHSCSRTDSKAKPENDISFSSPAWTRSSKIPQIGLGFLLYSINTSYIRALEACHIT
jgi:hypothetical protein